MKLITHILLGSCMMLFFSCTSSKKTQVVEYSQRINCHQETAAHFAQKKPQPIHEIQLDSILTNRFSFTSLNVAHAFGFLDILKNYVQIQKDYQQQPNAENRIRRLELSQELSEQINLSSLEISSFASELDCEEERITQIADYLKGKEKDRETRLTVAAIGVGAVGGVISGLLATNDKAGNSGDYLGIATGITETILGILILKNSKSIYIEHPRNALKDVWEGKETSTIFPPSVWYYLTYRNPKNGHETSLRQQVIARWKGFKQIDASDPKTQQKLQDLYFGEKAKYNTDELYNRSNMYDQLESYVKMMKQDLMSVSIEMERLKF